MVNYLTAKRLKILGHDVRISINIRPWGGLVEGNMALCPDGNYIAQVDYDKQKIELIRYELKAMQRKYNLGNFYILESSPGKYHAVCFSKMEWGEYNSLLQQLRCDPGFTQTKTYLLRTSLKKGQKEGLKFKEVLLNDSNRELSRAHIRHYVVYCKLSEISEHTIKGKWDNSTELAVTQYIAS